VLEGAVLIFFAELISRNRRIARIPVGETEERVDGTAVRVI